VEETRKWRYGVNRWFVLAFIILNIIVVQFYSPIMPHVQVAAEKYPGSPLFVLPVIGPFYWTNTLTAVLLADVILIAMAWAVRRTTSKGDLVPTGIAGALEAMLEYIYNLTESTAGHWAKEIFPYFATITLLVLVVNYMEMIPGVDSIGFLEKAEHGAQSYPIKDLGAGIATLVKGEGKNGVATGEGYNIVPFVRTGSTDLNFTLGLAICSVFMTQVLGAKALGPRYFSKFINTGTLFTRPAFGAIDFAVGILELISEISKLLSFTFRLFGNVFAGSVMLFLIGTMVPVFAQSAMLMWEFFVGTLQAIVFGMLTMAFMSMATSGHAAEE
jgi:F-type H+-transporting ATPase subunit a